MVKKNSGDIKFKAINSLEELEVFSSLCLTYCFRLNSKSDLAQCILCLIVERESGLNIWNSKNGASYSSPCLLQYSANSLFKQNMKRRVSNVPRLKFHTCWGKNLVKISHVLCRFFFFYRRQQVPGVNKSRLLAFETEKLYYVLKLV